MTDPEVTLTEAYHAVFDVKDAATVERIDDEVDVVLHNDGVRVAAYEATRAIAALMQRMGIEVPRRFDGDGRPSFADVDPDVVRGSER